MPQVSADAPHVATAWIARRPCMPHFDDMETELNRLARALVSGPKPFAFCGIGVARAGRPVFCTATSPGISADEDSIFRVASVSKIVTAAAFEGAANVHGIDRPYSIDAGPVLGLDLRHPTFPDIPVTLGMLMTHTSGLTDHGGYMFGDTIAAGWDANTMFGTHAPGTFFSYSNLGYILLAAAAEVLSGERFDVLVADALNPNGVTGGYNWAGLDADTRAKVLPTFRRDGADFVAMIDAVQPAAFAAGQDYRLGADTARFSPQGGLRMSLRGMLDLARVRAGVPDDPMWRKADGEGDYASGLFHDYGAGVQILPDPPFYPRPLIGHFGNAYGFNGGVWRDEAADISFAYALNGVAMGEENDDLSEAERQVFDTIARTA